MARTLSPRAAFRRRLSILLASFLLAGVGMTAQLVRLGVGHNAESLEAAERRLYRERWVPTVRGRVLDRHGRVLAQNRPSYEVAIEYSVLSGGWARARAREHARRAHAQAWSLMTSDEREMRVAEVEPVYAGHVAKMEEDVAGLLGVTPGEIEERRRRIVERVEALSARISGVRLEQYLQEQAERGVAVSAQMRAAFEDRANQPLAEEREPHVVGVVPDEVAFRLQRMTEQETAVRGGPAGVVGGPVDVMVPRMPGLVVRRTEDREYPFERMRVRLDRSSLPGPLRSEEPVDIDVEGVGIHVLGWMRGRALAEDVERRAARLREDRSLRERSHVETLVGFRDRGQYMAGDSAGRSGVEFSQESELRGLRGLRIDRLDTGEQRNEPPEPGRDVRLTIDIALQARVQALMSPEFGLARVLPWQGDNPVLPVGAALNGGAVVVEVDSGEVLAMVSTPGLTREAMEADSAAIYSDEVNRPWVNRAIEAPYPPGSILKALILPGAVSGGHGSLTERMACNGFLIPGQPDRLRCWIYREQYGWATHSARFGHDLDAVEALTVSCNIFFYTLGRRMGPRTIADTLREFGVGEGWGLGVGPEFPGQVGGAKTDDEGRVWYPNDGSDLTDFDATLMGIGQGPVAWTPLHAATAYATLARMGVYIRPRIVDDGTAPEVRELTLDRRAIEASLRGLDGVVNDPRHGTARQITIEGVSEPTFNAPGVHVWGKTGTATAPPYDPDGPSGPLRPLTDRDLIPDHSWVTVLVGPEGGRPRYAISVIMEYGGSGGRVSGPIVNQIVHALVAEGYL